MKILGVTVQEDLSPSSKVEEILGGCSSSLNVLRVLRAHGMPETVLHVVAAVITVARMLYAARHGGASQPLTTRSDLR